MTDREKCLLALKTAREEHIASSNGIRFYPVIEQALDFAIADIQEREERSKGCVSCNGSFGDNTIEFEAQGYSFCPWCGRPLKGADE